MADHGIRARPVTGAIANTTNTTLVTVPSGKEYTVRLLRATNISAADATVTVWIQDVPIAWNAPVAVGESVNILGPDFVTIPTSSNSVVVRASAANAIHLCVAVTERDV